MIKTLVELVRWACGFETPLRRKFRAFSHWPSPFLLIAISATAVPLNNTQSMELGMRYNCLPAKWLAFSGILDLKFWITLFDAPKLSIAILLLRELANSQAPKMLDASNIRLHSYSQFTRTGMTTVFAKYKAIDDPLAGTTNDNTRTSFNCSLDFLIRNGRDWFWCCVCPLSKCY